MRIIPTELNTCQTLTSYLNLYSDDITSIMKAVCDGTPEQTRPSRRCAGVLPRVAKGGPMRMLIVGAGAIGGFYGAHLVEAGRDVTFLVRPQRAEQLRRDGLSVRTTARTFTIRPNIATLGSLGNGYEAVLLAVKSYALEQAIEDFAPAVTSDTMILPVLNGMKHVDILERRFGKRAVGGCACKIAVDIGDDGQIRQLNPQQDMAYGEMDGSSTPRIETIHEFLQGAGFVARLSPDIAREMWEKWIFLAALGGSNALMRGTIGDIVAVPSGREFILTYLDEVVTVVSAVGMAPSGEFLTAVRQMLTAHGSPMTSSMYRDLLKGAPIEADQIVGDLITRARSRGIAVPLTEVVYANLVVYQNRLS